MQKKLAFFKEYFKRFFEDQPPKMKDKIRYVFLKESATTFHYNYSVMIRKFNWKLSLIHLVATLVLMSSFFTFSFLYDTAIFQRIRTSHRPAEESLQGLSADQFVYFVMAMQLSIPIAVLAGFIISLCISLIRKWSWLNAVPILLLLPFSGFIYSSGYLSYPLYSMKWIDNPYALLISTGSALLFISLWLFFSLRLFRLVNKKRQDRPALN